MVIFNVKEAPKKNKENMLAEAMINSDEEVLAKAIQDMLNNDKPKKNKFKNNKPNKEEQDK